MWVPLRPHRQPLHRHRPPCGPGGGGPGSIAQNLLPRLWVAVGRPRARHGEGRVPRPGGKEGSSCFLKYWGTPSGRAPEERAKCGSSVSPQALRGRAPEARTLSTRSGWGAPCLLPRHSCSRQGCWGPRASVKLSNPSCLSGVVVRCRPLSRGRGPPLAGTLWLVSRVGGSGGRGLGRHPPCCGVWKATVVSVPWAGRLSRVR